MNRTSRPPRYERPATEPEDNDFSDSEVEAFVQAPHRDDTVRPKTSVPKGQARRGKPQQERPEPLEATAESIEAVAKPEPKPGASGALFMMALARHIKPVPRLFQTQNTYIPDAGNMFIVVHQMTKLLTDNVALYERIPDYTSIALNLYYSHVYFYQILRARDAIGTLTRFERRSLRIYESIGKPEAWPIAIPMTGFIQALGACELDDKMYSFVSPAFPTWNFTKDKALTGLSNAPGIGRTPIVPAYQEFLRLFGKKTDGAYYDEDTQTYHPTTTPLSATNKFVGLEASLATSNDFQTLAFSSAWNDATETEEPVGSMSRGGVMTRVLRWHIPTIAETKDFTSGMENYLFTDLEDIQWMSNLLRISAGVNLFFPGSTNLGAIPPVTVRENFVQVQYKKPTARVTEVNRWYQPRKAWKLNMQSDTYGDSVNPLIQMGVASSTNATFEATIIPAGISTAFSPDRKGPFFVNDGTTVTIPTLQAEVEDQVDVTTTINELLFTLYDNNPK